LMPLEKTSYRALKFSLGAIRSRLTHSTSQRASETEREFSILPRAGHDK
jgi:hypothetical protein